MQVIDEEVFTILILSTVTATAIVTPLIQILYEPSKRYIVYRRRSILHTKPDAGLCMLTCVHTQSNVPTMINILEASNPTIGSPIVVYALHLVQLVGRAAPLLIPHKKKHSTSSSSISSMLGKPGGSRGFDDSKPIIKAFRIYEQQHEEGAISVHPFTVIADYSTMHHDVCTMALHKNVSLIIIPFHRLMRIDGGVDLHHSIRTFNNNILMHAPCSVGILVDQTMGSFCTIVGSFSHNIALLFFGGDDDREALAFVARMAHHPGVGITVMHFFLSNSISDWSREKKIDCELFEEFKSMNVGNKNVMCREVAVKDMEEIMSVISTLTNEGYDLLIVGMRHESNSLLAGVLNEWVESPELGVIGGLLASPDFGTNVSILVIRQQIHVRPNVPSFYNQFVSPKDNGMHYNGVIQSSGLSPKDNTGLKFHNPLS